MLGIAQVKGKSTLFYCFGHYRILAYKISAYEVYMIWWKPTEALKSIAISPSGWMASNGHTKDITRQFHGRSHDFCGRTCAQPFKMWIGPRFHRFCRFQIYFKDIKAMHVNYFEMKIIWHAKSILISPQNNRLGDPNLNGWWVIAPTSKVDPVRHRRRWWRYP